MQYIKIYIVVVDVDAQNVVVVACKYTQKESFIERSRLNNVPGKFLRVDVAPAQDQPDLLARHRADLESVMIIVALLLLMMFCSC